MKLIVSIAFLNSFLFSHCLPTTNDNELTEDDSNQQSKTCPEIFEDQGMNFSSFAVGAGHGIHSLSLEEIRHFFKYDAQELNRIQQSTMISALKTSFSSMLLSVDTATDSTPG